VSSTIVRNRPFPRFTFALASSAMALAAVATGAVGGARPATSAHSAAQAGLPGVAAAGSGARGPAALAAFSQPVRSSAAAAAAVRLSPRQIAWRLLRSHHWSTWQWKYLNWLWTHESGWNPYARNPYSGAYGIPQALPGSKMASAGPHWRTNARTQILWGMHYIRVRYHTPYGAWRHEVIYGWY
jgi:resuscitation-promoting factor RpfB